ncbi:MAG: hypothetical protein ACHP7K_09155 [Actinomycetales bacterium]
MPAATSANCRLFTRVQFTSNGGAFVTDALRGGFAAVAERYSRTVGATAHYVNAELDEGLSNAVRWHCERRVFLHGTRTVVLR